MSISDLIVDDDSQYQATELHSESSTDTPTFDIAYATIADSDTECEATEIDSDSPHGSDVELVPVSPAVPADYGNLRFWRGLTNMEQHIIMAAANTRISWQLPTPDAAEDIFHGHRIIKGMLNNGASKIKIGITYQPVIRWSNRRYGYQHLAVRPWIPDPKFQDMATRSDPRYKSPAVRSWMPDPGCQELPGGAARSCHELPGASRESFGSQRHRFSIGFKSTLVL